MGAFLAKNMDQAIAISNSRVEAASSGRFVMDTTFVLFFLAMDIGTSIGSFGLDGALAALTLGMFVVLPYFLPFSGQKPDFWGWIAGRLLILAVGILVGSTLQASAGTILPEPARYVPMTLLITSGIFCTYSQIYGIIRVRLAR
jgi:hypothetical protein